MNKEVIQIESEINERILDLEKRMISGQEIIGLCKKQMRVLKQKVKEYKRLKEQIVYKSFSDGDL